MWIYQSWPFLYYLISTLFSHAEIIQTAKLRTLITFSKQPNISYSLNASVLLTEGRCVCVSRTTMYKHRSTSISLTKTLKWLKAFNISQSRKDLEQQMQHPKTMVFKWQRQKNLRNQIAITHFPTINNQSLHIRLWFFKQPMYQG